MNEGFLSKVLYVHAPPPFVTMNIHVIAHAFSNTLSMCFDKAPKIQMKEILDAME